MSDLNTIARRHADEVRDAVAAARLPQLDTVRGSARAMPRPLWAILTAVAMLLIFSLPFVLGSDHPDLEEPVVATTTVPTPEVTSTLGTSAGGFIPTGTLSRSCSWCQGVLLADGRVLVLGGAEAEIYDPVTWTFTLLEEKPTPRVLVNAVLLHDGRVLVVGLQGYEGVPPSVDIFDPATDTFRSIEHPRSEGTAAVGLTDGRVLILGQERWPSPPDPVIFDPVTEQFTETGPATVLNHFEATLLDDGRVLVFGREGDAELYDPAADTFTPTGSMTTARGGFTVTKLADGRVLIVGGQPPEGRGTLTTAELYDPDTGTFTQTGSMGRARFWHAAALLPDSRVLVVGGGAGEIVDGTQTTAEIYDPVTGLFTEAPPLTTNRMASTAVSLADGTVLIFGHYPGNGGIGVQSGSKSAEIFTLTSVEQPIGCCGENPTVFVVTAEAGIDEGTMSLIVSPGGLEGAIEASYFFQSGGTGGGGELSLPSDCGRGCKIPIAGVFGTVTVFIAYEGEAPLEASSIVVSSE